MKIRTRLTLWYTGMLSGSLLLMGVVLHYELVGEFERGLPPETPREKIEDILLYYGMPTAAVLVLGGSWLIRRALRPLEELAAQVGRVHAGNLSDQVTRDGGGDEVDGLAKAFNEMLARVEAGTSSVRDFALYASHELKTPITILSAETELALNEPTLAGPERSRLASQAEELVRLGRLVDALSTFARSDAGLPVIAFESFDLSTLVRKATEDAQTIAQTKSVTLTLSQCEPVLVDGDSAALRQVLLNLLENAAKHNHAGGWVWVELVTNPDGVELTVENSGERIPADLTGKLFGRFARGSGASAGAGLGLSLAKTIIEAHGGRIHYESPKPGVVRFSIWLPRSGANTK